MKFNQDSITVNMVVKVYSNKYKTAKIYPEVAMLGDPQISIKSIQRLIASGDFTAEYIPATFTSNSTGTLIIEEKV